MDEFPMLRHGLVTFLNAQPDIVVCGEADSIPIALIKIAQCKPHLLVIGLRLGAGDTVDFIKALKVQNPDLLILVYSGFEESIFAMRALRAGAHGYLMKRSVRDEMVAAISDIFRGEICVSRELTMRVFKESLETQPAYRLPGRATRIENLSDREMHIFHLLGSGLGTACRPVCGRLATTNFEDETNFGKKAFGQRPKPARGPHALPGS